MHNNSFLDTLFSPLGPQYCNYFYYLSVIFFVVMCMAVLSVLLSLVQGKNKMKLSEMVMVVSQPLLLYFINERFNYKF